ncbi:hypothetical protein ABF87_10130 [Nitrosomonas sp. JL21]|uniref:hypothetical protein n=1 Tax=Nitrosomonas sp. JL21 TaxID=153949 RepID=UPI00136A8BB3|nr:hypothetical protein [Nitrosomonas sp. JL21]MBL8497968.1 hypothetical protein [Nitrosomonas sp.]MXS78309.1 hypothetical protein [Nitrosomonas sp. JL21]
MIALILITLGSLGVLASCTQTGRIPTDAPEAIKRAITRCDHEALAKYYDDAAKEMRLKVKEHRKILKSYESLTARPEDEVSMLQTQCRSLIEAYEQALKANLDMADFHRSIAGEMK